MSTPVASTASQYVNMARTAASSPDALEAGYMAKQTANDIQHDVREGDWSLRVLTLVAGLAMMVASINGFIGKFVTLRWDSAFLDAMVFCVGLAFILLESGIIRLTVCAATDAVISDKAPFLRSLTGRGVVFITTGCIEIYMKGILDVIVGSFAIYVGCTYLWMRHTAKQKLNAARKEAMASGGLERVQEQFALADIDGKGSLNLVQFRQFADNMGLALNKRESEAAFMQIDKTNKTGRLSYEAIQTWWNKGQK